MSQPYDRAARLYQTFHARSMDSVEVLPAWRVVPPVVVGLGTLQGLIYRTDKWSPGVQRNYIHYMEHPPRLVCDPEGRQLYLLGGSYRVTARGIEG